MAAIFEKCKQAILAAEGRYTRGKNDYGGETKFGISKRMYPDLDIAALTMEQAFRIIEEDYWNFYRLGEIDDQTIANQALLLLINMNPVKAGKIVQAAVNGCGRGVVVLKIDGVLGTISINAINSLSASWLSDRIRTESCRYYLAETDRDSKQIPNLRSWIRRALI